MPRYADQIGSTLTGLRRTHAADLGNVGFHHSAGTSDHVNNRANVAVALLMKSFDLAAGSQVYTGTPLYAYLSGWIDGMRAPGGSYYEGCDIATGRRFGQGSPAHYVPLWWILGASTP